MGLKKWVLLGSLVGVLAIVGCGQPKSGVSRKNKAYRAETKDAPKWVTGDLNHIKMESKGDSAVFKGRGEEDIVGNNVDYATDMAAAKARADLATNLKAELMKDVQEQVSRGNNALSETSSRTVSEKVDRVLTASKMLARWVGKDRVWVLVGLDKGVISKVRSELGLNSTK
ncbi:LPP20 family lipoprotein [Helicobacter suis]|uniref:LPP20 family lipoprotein n=1 Tax=Helicobacter suis TaxID=104628 RepID=UPI001581388B|nr:LPP20 family lipoprotein [Helicobacter suis]GFK16429.1 LPP20 lipoprotein [Helicobacter suis]